jgi:hypothetical protein
MGEVHRRQRGCPISNNYIAIQSETVGFGMGPDLMLCAFRNWSQKIVPWERHIMRVKTNRIGDTLNLNH